jgi:hypothetical protein
MITNVKSERGTALILTMMIILAMTGLGALAFSTASVSATTTTHAALQKRAAFAAEIAMLSGVEWLEANLDTITQADPGSELPVFTEMMAIGGSRPELVSTAGGSEAYFGDDPFGAEHLEPFFTVRFSGLAPARRAAEFDDRFCYMRLNMSGEAGITDQQRAASDSINTENEMSGSRITRSFSGHFYVGPVACPSFGG